MTTTTSAPRIGGLPTRVASSNQKNQDLWIVDVPAAASPGGWRRHSGKFNEKPLLLTADGKSVLVGLEPEGENPTTRCRRERWRWCRSTEESRACWK